MGKNCAGIPAKFTAKIARAASAGESCTVLHLGTASVPPKRLKPAKKRLKSAENWYFDNKKVYYASGEPVPGIAAWCGRVAVEKKAFTYRYRILWLYYNEALNYYAIPIPLADSLNELPGIRLSHSEVHLLLMMAEELRDEKSDREEYIRLSHPAKADLKSHALAFNADCCVNQKQLLAILENGPHLLPLITASMDTQVHALRKLKSAPYSVYNFTLSTNDLQVEETIFSIFSALNFANHSSQSEPLCIRLKDERDLQEWFTLADRMAILRTASGTLLRPIVRQITLRERCRKTGGLMPEPLPTVPIAISRGVLNRPEVLDIMIPKQMCAPDRHELDVLRHAMSKTLQKIDVPKMYRDWKTQLSSAGAYFLRPDAVWREMLIGQFLDIVFEDKQLRARASALLKKSERVRAEEERKRAELIQRAMERLQDTSGYAQQIIGRPASKKEAEDALAAEAVAFRFIPEKGDDRKKKFLAFSHTSLKRFLKQSSIGEEMVEAFLNACEKADILDNRKRSVSLGGSTFPAVTFAVDF